MGLNKNSKKSTEGSNINSGMTVTHPQISKRINPYIWI